MNGSTLAAVASLLAVLLWWRSGRRPAPLVRSIDTRAVAALNRAQISQARQRSRPQRALPPLGDGRQRQRMLQQLSRQLGGERDQRLAAMELARQWGDRATLPLLHRGLRDVDPAVRQEAVAAINRFRGRSAGPGALPPQLLPRNVARTR